MRVALLTNNLFPPREGIGRHILEVSKRLKSRGHDPLVVARSDHAFGVWHHELVEGVPVCRYPWRPLRPFHQWLAGRDISAWLKRRVEGFHLLHVHLPLLPPLSVETSSIVTFHTPLLSDTAAICEPGIKPALIRANAKFVSRHYEQAWLDSAKCVTAVSTQVRQELAALYHVPANAVRLVPNGVDCHYFGAIRRCPESFILYVGRLGYRKGLLRLVEALALLHSKPAPRLVLLGEGPLQRSIEKHATRLGIADRLLMKGFVDRKTLRMWLSEAACFVNPADYESGPLTLLEAMAAGTPVVTTRTGLVSEFGADPPVRIADSTPAGLAHAISTVLADRHAAEEMGGDARTLVGRAFDWELAVDGYEQLYQEEGRLAA